MMKPYKNEAGFTLVEILIVVLIIGIIAALAIPNLITAQRTSWTNACAANRSTLQASSELFRMMNGSLPTAWTALTTGTDPVLNSVPDCPANSSNTYTFVGTTSQVTCSGIGTDHN